MSKNDEYESPLSGRYCSKEMKTLFSQRERSTTWRKLWLWLAEAEKSLGVDISDEAISQMRDNLHVSDEAFKFIAKDEAITRHDVMSHIHAFEADVGPAARGKLHIGATSCYVTDNGDLIHIKNGLDLVLPKLAKVIHNLSQFAAKYRDLPTLSYTHYQPAVPMSLGKRACHWTQEFLMDLEDIEIVRENLRFRGAQGTTGTQASYLDIFQGDASKIDKLNEMLCEKAGFKGCYDISTQTYTRKVDLRVANALCAFGATAVRFASDIRHLCHDYVLDEPREKTQIGSSAMPWKHNCIRSERVCSLGRKLSNLQKNFSDVFSNQWLERTLDDSSSRRCDIPELFLLTDAILTILDNISGGLVVFEAIAKARLAEELPFMATERILMKLVKLGVSRQEAHERLRVLSFQAMDVVKSQGGKNDMMERIKNDEFFKPIWGDLDGLLDPQQFIGRSADIVDRFTGPGGPVAGHLKKYSDHIAAFTWDSL